MLYYRNKIIPDPKTSSPIMLSQTDRPGQESTSTAGATRTQEARFIGNRDRAYETLFNAWQIRYDAMSNTPPDKQAQAAGLHWFEGRANLNTLRQLNKPVVLRFIEATGKEYYVALTRLNGDMATYTLDGELRTGDIGEITRRWSGDYALLSRLPTTGGVIAPFRNSKEDTARTSKFAKTVTERIQAFQVAVGVRPGGSIDPKAIINTHVKDPVLLDPTGGT